MIYLITGSPGTGKTLHMISMLKKREDLQGRPLYLDGIPDVDPEKIPHSPIPEGHDVKDWYDWLPPKSILVVDEAQRWFRPRPNGSAVPKHVSELETHRHKGVDIFLLTQHPRLLDINVKSFVDTHKHIWKTQLNTRSMWEWKGCKNPDSKSDIKDAIVRPYRLDSSVFGLYKSAEVHTKIKTARSKWVWLFPLILLFTAALAFYSYRSFKNYFASPASAAQQAESPAADEGGGAAAPHQSADAGQFSLVPPPEQVRTLKPEDFKPVMDGKPWTAPAYAALNTQITTMPFPVACVQQGEKCTCYTEQATPIRDIDKGLCLDFVENGIYNPYRPPQASVESAPVQYSGSTGGSVLSLGGQTKPTMAHVENPPNMAQ